MIPEPDEETGARLSLVRLSSVSRLPVRWPAGDGAARPMAVGVTCRAGGLHRALVSAVTLRCGSADGGEPSGGRRSGSFGMPGETGKINRSRVCGFSGEPALPGELREEETVDEHLRIDPDDAREADHAGQADVLAPGVPLPRAEAVRRADALLAQHAGCLVAAVPVTENTGCVVGLHDGRRLTLLPVGGALLCRRERACVASLIHAWLAAGRPPGTLTDAVVRVPNGSVRLLAA